MVTERNGVCRLLLAAAACATAMTSALAASDISPGEQVTIQDSRYAIRHDVIERSIGNMSKMEVYQTSVSTGVAYSDLDLSKDSDVAILKDRAKKAAWDVCRVADHRAKSPLDRRIGLEPDCFATARQQALANVNRIVADARAGRNFAAK